MMTTLNKSKALILLPIFTVLLLTIESCKKDAPLNYKNSSFKESGNLTLKNGTNLSRFLSYDAAHDVLMFEGYNEIEELENVLQQFEDNYPYNRGNDAVIFSTLEDIRNFGWTNANSNGNNPHNKVNISDFKALLEDSYPLSDEVLKEIVYTYDVVNPSFAVQLVRPVYQRNASFSYDVRQTLINSDIPNGIKNQILQFEDNEVMVPNFAFNDFLELLPSYNSLYEDLYENERQQLLSGMDPADPNFDNDIVMFEFERLIMNDKYEIYIDNHLFKLYSDCRLAVIQADIDVAYQQLQLIDNNGFVTPPNVIEDEFGIQEAEMINYFPINTILISPENLTLEFSRKGDPTISMTETMAYNDKFNCPTSAFDYIRDSLENLKVVFASSNNSLYSGSPIYHYWSFGDGTYSFMNNPVHVYSQAGVYTVKHTVFNEECQCWDVNVSDVVVGFEPKSCNTLTDFDYLNQNGLVEVTVSLAYNSTPGAQIANYLINWGEPGSTDQFYDATLGPTFQHQYTTVGNFDITVYVIWDDNCYGDATVPTVGISSVPCCDRFFSNDDNWGKNSAIDVFGDNSARLGIKDRANGDSGFLGFGARQFKTEQKFYRRKNNGNFTSAKADHGLHFIGFAQRIEVVNGIESCDQGFIYMINNNQYNKSNKRSASHVYPDDAPWNRNQFGLNGGTVTVDHWVRYGGTSKSTETTIGECP